MSPFTLFRLLRGESAKRLQIINRQTGGHGAVAESRAGRTWPLRPAALRNLSA